MKIEKCFCGNVGNLTKRFDIFNRNCIGASIRCNNPECYHFVTAETEEIAIEIWNSSSKILNK
jgi:hypothetical protein